MNAVLESIPPAALKLLGGILLGYPLGIIWRLLPKNKILKNSFATITGFVLTLVVFGITSLLFLLFPILVTYFLLFLAGFLSRKLAVGLSFVFNLSYLLWAYVTFSTDHYDIDWTTPGCVLCLKLIGLSFDFFDGGKSKEELAEDKEQQQNALKTLPSLIEVLGFTFFFGGFFAGPLFSFSRYRDFVSHQLFAVTVPAEKASTHEPAVPTPSEPVVPTSFLATFQVFCLGVAYLGITQWGSSMWPASALLDYDWLHNTSFFYRMAYIFCYGKFVLTKYLGVWLLSEGPLILCGLGFGGYDAHGHPHWRAMRNVHVRLFETSPNFSGVIQSFNINTNAWVKHYIFKRLKWARNKHLSQFAALSFLIFWHGYAAGYFMCFYSEFIWMIAESAVHRLHHPLVESLKPLKIPSKLYTILCWLIRLMSFHYILIPFDLKLAQRFFPVFNSVYWIGHVTVFAAILLQYIAPKPKHKGKDKEGGGRVGPLNEGAPVYPKEGGSPSSPGQKNPIKQKAH